MGLEKTCILFLALPILVYGAGEDIDCTQEKVDVVLVVDDSGSINDAEFALICDFLVDVVSNLTLDYAGGTAIGIVEYATSVNRVTLLDTYQTEADKAALIASIENKVNTNGFTNTHLAFQEVINTVFPNTPGRTASRRIVILLTDGMSTQSTLTQTEAANLRALAEVFAIGVDGADETELNGIASDPDNEHVFLLNSFDLLETIISAVVAFVCPPCDPDCIEGICDRPTNTCDCNVGFTGERCEICMLECDDNATCIINDCVCDDGFEGDGDPGTCTDIDECLDMCGGCDPNATCTNTIGSFICQCEAGFTGDGFTCTDIDECEDDDSCVLNATCTNTIPSFTCECDDGFVGDGFNFCDDIDECEEGCDNCDVNAKCINTIGSFECECCDGYQGNGTTCEDIDECDTPGACVDNAACMNIDGSYICTCDEGFVGDGFNFCDDIDECEEGCDDCDENAICTNTVGSFTCECIVGYTGNGITCIPLL